jgi:hypothetical protein
MFGFLGQLGVDQARRAAHREPVAVPRHRARSERTAGGPDARRNQGTHRDRVT